MYLSSRVVRVPSNSNGTASNLRRTRRSVYFISAKIKIDSIRVVGKVAGRSVGTLKRVRFDRHYYVFSAKRPTGWEPIRPVRLVTVKQIRFAIVYSSRPISRCTVDIFVTDAFARLYNMAYVAVIRPKIRHARHIYVIRLLLYFPNIYIYNTLFVSTRDY